MVICELCGSANVEMDELCRVCGQALRKEQPAPASVVSEASASTPAQDAGGWPLPQAAPTSTAGAQPPVQVQTVEPVAAAGLHASGASSPDLATRSLQMSAVSSPVESVTPPMLGGATEIEQAPMDNMGTSDVPGFMQAGGRTGPAAPEPVQLISASDLPDWLKQIAEADEAKAAAEAQKLAAHSDAPATIVKKALPGETLVTAPTTNWLSKSNQAQESTDHWDSTEIANANWGNPDGVAHAGGGAEYPTIVPPTAFVPSSTEAYPTAKPKSRLARGRSQSSSGSTSGSSKPFYRNQTVQLAAIVVMAAILAMLLLT